MHSDDTIDVAGAPPAATHEDEHGDEQHVHLPPPSIAPITLAAGITLAGAGLVTWWPVSIVGLLVMFYGIIDWIQELRHEYN